MGGFIGYILTAIATTIPLWVWIVVAVALVLVAYRLLGLRGSMAALGFVAIWIAVIFGEQRGRSFQLTKDTKDADKLIQKANAVRDRANANAGVIGVRDRPKSTVRDYRD